MTAKTLHRYFMVVVLVFLAACDRQTITLPTETLIPTAASSTPIPTLTLIPVTFTPSPLPITPSPLPTEPIITLLTPDANQVERWNEYEEALASVFFRTSYQPEKFVCEWMIFGQADLEVYVYAYCSEIYASGPSAASIPAVIHVGTNGSVQNAEIPGAGSLYGPDIRRMFPQDVTDKIFSPAIHSQELWKPLDDHMRWRRAHPEEPPLVVLPFLSAQPAPTDFPWVTPDPIQVKNWKDYQTVLAKKFDYRPPEEVVCEWEILGSSEYQVYIWTVCGGITGGVGLEGLSIIYIGDDGVVQSTDNSGPIEFDFPSRIRDVFPPDVQEKYFNGLIHFQELVDHLRWRQIRGHREEPPLIIIKATTNP